MLPVRGAGTTSMIIIGDAPYGTEAQRALPFSSAASNILAEALHANNITFNSCLSTTLLSKALPRDEELDTLYVTSEKAGLAAGWEFINGLYASPTLAIARRTLLEWLDNQHANVVLLCGDLAMWAVTGERELESVLAGRDLSFLLMQLFPRTLLLSATPNLLFPGRAAVGVATPVDLVAIVPPPIAWGSSTPWRYDERPDETLAAVAHAFGSALVADGALDQVGVTLAPEDRPAVPAAVAVLALRAFEGQAAADQYQVLAKRTLGLRGLPAVVAALSDWLGE